MKRLLVVAVVAIMLFAVGGVAWAVAIPEANSSAGSFTGTYNFSPASTASPCTGEDGGTYVYDSISIKTTSVGSAGGDFSLSSSPSGQFFIGKMVFNQATRYGWARGTLTVLNGPTNVSGAYTAVVAPNGASGLRFRGMWLGKVKVSNVLTGDITIENFEFKTPTTTSGTLSGGSWGGAASNGNLSIKTNTATC